MDGALPELRADRVPPGGGGGFTEPKACPTWPLRDAGIFPLEPGGGGRPVGMGPPAAVLWAWGPYFGGSDPFLGVGMRMW